MNVKLEKMYKERTIQPHKDSYYAGALDQHVISADNLSLIHELYDVKDEFHRAIIRKKESTIVILSVCLAIVVIIGVLR